MKIYPAAFPAPLVEGYAYSVDMGVSRTQMENGRARQRRRYRSMPHNFNMQFAIERERLGSWQDWVNAYAYDWFSMPAASFISSGAKKNCSPHIVRFAGDMQIAPINENVWRIAVNVEMAPYESFYTPGVSLTDDWIIAKTPGTAAADWVIAQTVDNDLSTAATDRIISGSPLSPAAYV